VFFDLHISGTVNRRSPNQVSEASDFVVALIFVHFCILHNFVRRGGVVVRASDLQPRGRRVESRTTLGKYVVHTRVPLFTKQYKLVPAQAVG